MVRLRRPIRAKAWWCACVLVLRASILAAGQEAEEKQSALGSPAIRFQNFGIDDGLADRSVQAVLQDRLGFLWVGTLGGVHRYDGYSFELFEPEGETAAVTAMVEGPDGTLWIGTETGLLRLDPTTERFSSVPYDPEQKPRARHRDVAVLQVDRAGTVWVGTGAGLDLLDATSSSYRRDPAAEALKRHFENVEISTFFEDQAGKIWIGTEGLGLYRINPDLTVDRHFRHDPGLKGSLPEDSVRAVQEDRDGSVWVGTNRRGLWRLDPATDRFRDYSMRVVDLEEPAEVVVWELLLDRSDTLWAATYGDGLYRLDRESDRFVALRSSSLDLESLSHNQVRSLYQDRAGALWVGTYGGGLNKWDPGAAKFRTYRHLPGSPLESIPPGEVYSVLEDSAGRIWTGTFGGGVSRYDPRDGTYSHFRHDAADPTSLSSDRVLELFEDSSGRVWIGTYDAGLNRFVPDRNAFVQYVERPGDTASLLDNDVRGIAEDNDGYLWVATFRGGLQRLDPESDEFTHFQHDPSDPRSLSSAPITSLRMGPDDALWTGHWVGGLNRFDLKTNTVQRFETTDAEQSLGDNRVWGIAVDPSGDLWIATGRGLNRMDIETRSFERLMNPDSSANQSYSSLVLDEAGAVWLGTRTGIVRFEPGTKSFASYDAGDGAQNGYLNSSSSAIRTSTNELLFGGVAGLTAFSTEEITVSLVPPPAVLTDFQVFNRPVEIGGDSPLDRSIVQAEEIVLEPRHKVFSISFSGLNFRAPWKNRYRYRLRGFDARWTETDSRRRFVTYTSLPAGKYTFEVLAANNDGQWSKRPRELSIRVLPPFWKTWWFRVLAGVLLTLGVWGAHGLRLRAIRQQNRELELRVDQRTSELQKANDELEAANDELEAFAGMVSHDLRAPLRAVDGYSGILLEELGSSAPQTAIERFGRIRSRTREMQQLLDDLLSFCRVRDSAMEARSIDLSALAERIAADLADQHPERIVAVDIEPGLHAQGDESLIRVVVRNLLENAWKYSAREPRARVEVGSVEVDGVSAFFVRDNGAGFDPTYQDKLFRAFERLHRSEEFRGAGLGLATVQKIVHRHGGTVWASSELGQGATFFIALPTAPDPGPEPEVNRSGFWPRWTD